MTAPGLFIVAVIAFLAGAVARRLVPGRASGFAGLVAGAVGGVLGVAGSEAAGLPMRGVGALVLAALAGAILLLGLRALVPRR